MPSAHHACHRGLFEHKNAALAVVWVFFSCLIFATGAVDLHATGLNGLPTLALMAAGSIIAILVTPWVWQVCLRWHGRIDG